MKNLAQYESLEQQSSSYDDYGFVPVGFYNNYLFFLTY